MSQAATDFVIASPRVPRGHLLSIMLILAAYCERRTAPYFANLSVAAIAAALRLSHRRARRIIAEATGAGLISVASEPTNRDAATYQLLL